MLLGLLTIACNNTVIEKQDFIFPDDFSGWVFVEYEVKDAPALPKVGDREQVVIPASGVIQIPNPFVNYRLDYTYKTKSGTVLPSLTPEKLYNEEKNVVREKAFVCCGASSIIIREDVEHKYHYFYAGKGPAKDPPTEPASKK